MYRPLLRPSATLVAVAVGLVVPLLPATPAAAAEPVERRWAIEQPSPDTAWALYYYDGDARTTVEESANVDVINLSASGDGSRVIYIRSTYATDGSVVREEVVVRDLSSRQVRVLETAQSATTGDSVRVPILSPDGTRAMWESYDGDTGILSTRKAAVAGGAAATLATGFSPYAFLDNDTALMQDMEFTPFTQPYAGGARTLVEGLPPEALNVTVSPDGSKVAFGFYEDDVQADMLVAPLTLTGGVATVGATVTLEATGYNSQPAFSRDGQVLTWAHGAPDDRARDLWSAPTDGSAPAAAVAVTERDDVDVAFTDLPSSDTTAPGAVTTDAPFTLAGTTATIRWTLPADADLSGVTVSRPGRSVFVPAPATSYLDTGLAVGTTYGYTVTPYDRSGNAGPADTRSLTAVSAVATFQDPTSRTTIRAPFPVRFGAGGVSYTVDYSINGGGFRGWVANQPVVQRTFGSAAATGFAATTSTPGLTYRFRVVGRDSFGNSTVPTLSGKAVVPFDQTKAALSGGSNVGRGDSWLGTLRILNRTTHYARVAITGDRFQLIGERCPTCGIVDVYDGATRIASVDTRASARQARQVLYTRTWSVAGNHTITLRPRATAGRPNVVIDGFAVRR